MKKLKNLIHISISGIVQSNEKCIIFLSLGELSRDFFSSKYGFNFLNVLIGKSYLSITIDRKTGKAIDTFYSHTESIKKHNGSDIDANFFLNKKNEIISGIIFTEASVDEEYNTENTFLFLNPFAKNKITIKDFKSLIYWKNNKDMEYIPRYKGKNLWYKFKNNIF